MLRFVSLDRRTTEPTKDMMEMTCTPPTEHREAEEQDERLPLKFTNRLSEYERERVVIPEFVAHGKPATAWLKCSAKWIAAGVVCAAVVVYFGMHTV